MCILLVEDEPLIRAIVAEVLYDAGFDVSQADNGERAWTLIKQARTAFDLLVTDIHMPGARNGLGVSRLMRQRWPLVPVVYITARPDALAELGPNEAVVPKPFFPSTLVETVRRLLASGDAGRAP